MSKKRKHRNIVTITLNENDLKRLMNPEQNEGESRQDWKDRTFMQRYGGGAGIPPKLSKKEDT